MVKDSENKQAADTTGSRSCQNKDEAERPAQPGWLSASFDPSPETLFSGEPWWRDHFQWLKEAGYLLRPRYDPAWVPSWIGTKKDWYRCEDGTVAWFTNLLDATCIEDGSYVGLKRINKTWHPYETEIAQFVSSEPLSSDATNHCIPVKEVLQVPDDENLVILVMPFLRPFDDPPFDTVGETIECFRQIFEGLQFMHKHRIAHRDCSSGNIMMDATELYPESFHPWKQSYTRDYSRKAKHHTRTQYPPKYYLIDFGISRRYGADEVNPLEGPIVGGDKTVPEFQKSNAPQDPFQTDIYYVGNMMKEECLEKFLGFDFLEPLIADMTQANPKKRPNIDEAFSRFETIRKSLSTGKLRARVVPRESDDSTLSCIFSSIAYWTRRISYTLKRVPPIPSS